MSAESQLDHWAEMTSFTISWVRMLSFVKIVIKIELIVSDATILDQEATILIAQFQEQSEFMAQKSLFSMLLQRALLGYLLRLILVKKEQLNDLNFRKSQVSRKFLSANENYSARNPLLSCLQGNMTYGTSKSSTTQTTQTTQGIQCINTTHRARTSNLAPYSPGPSEARSITSLPPYCPKYNLFQRGFHQGTLVDYDADHGSPVKKKRSLRSVDMVVNSQDCAVLAPRQRRLIGKIGRVNLSDKNGSLPPPPKIGSLI